MTKLRNAVETAKNGAAIALKKSSPDILIGLGIGGVIVSTVLACAATLKTSNDLSEHNIKIEEIKNNKERGSKVIIDTDPASLNSDMSVIEYTDELYKRDLTKAYFETAGIVIKNYSLAVLLCSASIAALIGSHKILYKRYAAASSALALVDGAFKDYRKRVQEDLGYDADQKYRYGLETIEQEYIDEDTNKRAKKKVDVVDPDRVEYTGFARVFDSENMNWDKDASLNMFFLRNVENWANEVLKSKKHIFLNDVYRELGFEETPIGQIVGWTYNPECPNGDNYVDFGLNDISNERVRAFMNGYENVVILDFNPDGDILKLM